MDGPTFTRTRFRVGYGRAAVDAAVERITVGGMSADEVRALVFPPVRNGPGYDIGEVDAWLDEVYVARGGRPVAGPENAPWPMVAAALLEPDPRSVATADLGRAAFMIVVAVGVAVWLYVSRF